MSTKVLIVEDDKFLLEMYNRKFSSEGFEVVAAEDGEKGIEAMRREKPEIVLLDIVMPKMDGFEVLEKVKKDEEIKNIPIILLTNLGQKTDVERGLRLGAETYIIKAHYTPSEVVEKVKDILQARD